MKKSIRVRFAPSPTGFLHVGSARTALFNWIFSQKNNAQYILRIEDTDRNRSKKEYLEEIIESLTWLSIRWSECIYQSKRLDIYRSHAEQLLIQRKAYKEGDAVIFKCDFSHIEFDDLIRGTIAFSELPKDTEVLIKSDGTPTYNFACCVDDALLGITHVIRGEDHIPNTPKQLLLYRALGHAAPQFAHLPMILSEEGGKLSKRHGATSIREYKAAGYLPEAVVNYLLLLGWSPKNNQEIIPWSEAVRLFNIRHINKTAAAFSIEKLNWMNAEYIKHAPLRRLSGLVEEFLKQKSFLPQNYDREYIGRVTQLLKSRLNTLSDMTSRGYSFFKDNFDYAPETEDILAEDISEKISYVKERLSKIDNFDKTIIEETFRAAASELGVKAKVLVHPVRVALTGQRVGPGLFETMEVLGKESVVARLARLVSYWKKEGI